MQHLVIHVWVKIPQIENNTNKNSEVWNVYQKYLSHSKSSPASSQFCLQCYHDRKQFSRLLKSLWISVVSSMLHSFLTYGTIRLNYVKSQTMVDYSAEWCRTRSRFCISWAQHTSEFSCWRISNPFTSFLSSSPSVFPA